MVKNKKGGDSMISLLEVIKIPTNSGRTWRMERFITDKLKEMEVEFETDSLGNIYKLYPDTPIISSHMDSVGSTDDIAALQYAERINGKIVGFGNLGADDKVGVWICLSIIQRYKNKISFIFSVDEEKGGIGIKAFTGSHKETIKNDILYALVFDRMGASDIIGTRNDYCTKEFQNEVEDLLEKYGYKSASGTFSDADSLSDCISTVNLSIGYYGAHSGSEYVVIKDAKRALYAGIEIIENLKKKFPACEKSRKVYVSRGGYRGFERHKNWEREWEQGYNSYVYKNTGKDTSIEEDKEVNKDSYDDSFQEVLCELFEELSNAEYWQKFQAISQKYKASIYIMPPLESGVIRIRTVVSEGIFTKKNEIIKDFDELKESIKARIYLPVEIIVQKEINTRNKDYGLEALEEYHPTDQIAIKKQLEKIPNKDKEILAQLNAAALRLFVPKSKDDLSLQDISETFNASLYVSTELYNGKHKDGLMKITVVKDELNKGDADIVRSLNQYLERVMPTQLKIEKVKGMATINLRRGVDLLTSKNNTIKDKPFVLALFPKKDIKALNKGGEIN